MKDKILSIIIPSYNMQEYIAKCLDSLILPEEKMAKIQILVINDGSKDNTSQIAHSYQDKYPNSIFVIDKQNGNYGSCINRGLLEATGKYVKVLDADDRFDTSNFAEFVTYLDSVDCDLVMSNYTTVTTECDEIKTFKFDIDENKNLQLNEMSHKVMMDLQMHAITYKKEILTQINYKQSEGISFTDQQWCFYPMSVVKDFCYFNRVVYLYTVGRAGQTMDPNYFLKNQHNEIAITSKMITDYESVQKNGNETNHYYIYHRLFSTRIFCLYDLFLLNQVKLTDNNQLIEFDNFFKKANNQLYIQASNHTLSKKLPIKYINAWQKKYNRNCLKLKLTRLYKKLRDG